MTRFTVHVAVVHGLIGSLEELERLGTIRQMLDFQNVASKCIFALKDGSKSSKDNEWIEFPKGTVDYKVIRDALDVRISELVAHITKHYNFDPCDTAIMMKHS